VAGYALLKNINFAAQCVNLSDNSPKLLMGDHLQGEPFKRNSETLNCAVEASSRSTP